MRRLEIFELTCSVDTIGIKSKTNVPIEHFKFITKKTCLKGDYFSYRLNPDLYYDNYTANLIDNLSAVKMMATLMNLKNPIIYRIDFRCDSFEDNFNKLSKLNRLLLLLVTIFFRIENRYISRDLLTLEELTSRIQNSRFEVENYNKSLQERGSIVKNRIEMRSKKLNYGLDKYEESLINEFEIWMNRLKKVIGEGIIRKFIESANKHLVKLYKDESKTNGFNTGKFLYKYTDCIYLRDQLLDFFTKIDADNPVQKTKSYLQYNDIELFGKIDLIEYIKIIEDSWLKFLNPTG